MELITSLLALAKSFFPSTLGSVIAVWRKRGDVKFKEMPFIQKLSIIVLGIFAIMIGIALGKWIGGVIIAKYALTGYSVHLMEFVCALSGLKFVDSAIKSVDASLDVATENIPKIVSKVFENISDSITKFFTKK